jgi:iron(III) transport system substrate-binding protein
MQSLSRCDALRAAAAATAGTALAPAGWVWAAAPETQKITPLLIAAAQREGKVSFYTSVDLPVAEKVAKASRQGFPTSQCAWSVPARSENFQRIAQE